jgi:hypothetical protein
MTRTTNARLAGIMLLLYIAIGMTQMLVFGGATAGNGMAAKLANMAQHATDVRINVVLGFITAFFALGLAVTFHAITREQDPDLAMMGLVCRVGEAISGAVFIPLWLGLLSLATAAGANVADAAAKEALASLILAAHAQNPTIAATFFAVGSTFFSWLLLRGRMIPAPLAWLGVFASVLLVIGLPLQLAAVLRGSIAQLIWLPMAAFEIPLAFWLIIKGVAVPARRQAAGV